MPFGPRPVIAALLCAFLAISGFPLVAFAQNGGSSPAEDTETAREREPTRIYIGMWTWHMKDTRRPIDNNWLVGVVYRGFFAGTYINSFGKRAYTAGIQRSFAKLGEDRTRAWFGYRVGAVSGYDGRFMGVAHKTPVLPIASAYAIVERDGLGIELSYTFVVLSAALTYRF
jgi:hypothetical protein